MRSALLILVAASGLGGCDNMQHQPNQRPLESAARPWPAHTVARGAPVATDPLESGFRDGVPLARNPLTITAELLARGHDRFDIYCAVCHGADGYGAGIVVRRGFPAPASFHEDGQRQLADGQLFDAISRGSGAMRPLADRLTTRDRWAVVAYIRALQRSQHASLADVPDPARAALQRP